MIKTNGFRVLAMVMTTLWMVTIIPVTVVQAADFRGQGFDLSSYNGTVNWEQVAEADMDFVMIRTGEGRAPDVDTQFAANYDGAVAAGLKVGVYHVCCVRTPKEAVEEAEYCLEILDGRDLDYPVAYDMERKGTFAGGMENTTAIAKAFCDTVADAGYVPMIYSSASFLNENFDWKKLKTVKSGLHLTVIPDQSCRYLQTYGSIQRKVHWKVPTPTKDIVIWSIPTWKQQVLSSRNPHLP